MQAASTIYAIAAAAGPGSVVQVRKEAANLHLLSLPHTCCVAAHDKYYWIGVTRQPNPSRLSSNDAAGQPFFNVPGEALPMFAPSNGPHEGPQYAPYAHWGPFMWTQNRLFTYSGNGNGDCVLSDIYYG
jgi:hypothetical protein